MKKLVLILCLTIAFISCEKDNNNTENNSIEGRWHLVGFEDTVMYEFTSSLRHIIYSTDGTFGLLETAIPNPNTWYYEDNKLVIDLNFGNFSTSTLEYRCNGNVVDFISEDGSLHSTLFREGFDISSCN